MSDHPQNAFKNGLLQGRVQRGAWCTIPDTLVAEILGRAGFDWVLVDTEHSAMDPPKVLPMLQTLAACPCATLVRPGALDAVEIKRLLDLGAQSLLIPYVQTPEEAAYAVSCVTYPPEGIRGVAGATRASRFGTVAHYHRDARDQICLILQVETAATLDRIEEIASVPGVDALFIGPADLAASLGHLGEPSHPEVTEAVLDAIRRIVAAGKPAGILALDENLYARAIEAGATFVSRDLDMVALKRGLSKAR